MHNEMHNALRRGKTMPTTKESWDQVGESWRDLGRHLGDQCQKLSEDQAEEAREDRATLDEAANKLSAHVGEALSSMRELVKDPATKDSVDRVIRSMGEALSATFDVAADEIRQYLPGREAVDAPSAGASEKASAG
jgi:DNA-binding ferritin-like protein